MAGALATQAGRWIAASRAGGPTLVITAVSKTDSTHWASTRAATIMPNKRNLRRSRTRRMMPAGMMTAATSWKMSLRMRPMASGSA